MKTHVASVLVKIWARDRAQAVVFAYESGYISLGLVARTDPRKR